MLRLCGTIYSLSVKAVGRSFVIVVPKNFWFLIESTDSDMQYMTDTSKISKYGLGPLSNTKSITTLSMSKRQPAFGMIMWRYT